MFANPGGMKPIPVVTNGHNMPSWHRNTSTHQSCTSPMCVKTGSKKTLFGLLCGDPQMVHKRDADVGRRVRFFAGVEEVPLLPLPWGLLTL